MQLLPRIFDGIIGYAPKSLGAYAVDYFQSLSATEYDTIAYSGTDYKVYHTFQIPWCGTQAGNVKPIQLTKRIKLYADHYANKPAGVINAKQWAISNGFDVEGIENLSDLDFYVGEETNLSAYPYLMSKETLDKLGGFSNFLGYVQSQSSEYVIPVVMADLYSFYTRAGAGVSLLPEEIQNAPAISSEPLPLHAGDSGKPVFLAVDDYDGNRKDILLTHIYQLTNGWGSVPVQGFGSNMTKAFEIIKAFCEANNEQLNVFEVNCMTTDNLSSLTLAGKEVETLYINGKLAFDGRSYDIESVGFSAADQTTSSLDFSSYSDTDTPTLYVKTNAKSISGCDVGVDVYLNYSQGDIPHSSFGLVNPVLSSGYVTGTTPELSSWLTNIASQGTVTFSMWIQDTGYIEESAAKGAILSQVEAEFATVRETTLITTSESGQQEFNIVGDLDQQWLANNGFGTFDEDYLFVWSKNVTAVEIGTHVTSVGDSAFDGCSDLTRLTMENGLTSIGNSAFSFCGITNDITIPNSVTTMGDGVFDSNPLTSITIPSSVTSIGVYCFMATNDTLEVTFIGRTIAQVQAMTNYNWGINSGSTIHCTDGDITVS